MFRTAVCEATKRWGVFVKWRGNYYRDLAKLFCTQGVKSYKVTNNFARNDSIFVPFPLKRFNGSALSGTKRVFHFRAQLRNPGIDALCLKPKKSPIVCRNFHLSEPRRAAPILPVIGAFLARFSGPIAQFLKLMAVVAGR